VSLLLLTIYIKKKYQEKNKKYQGSSVASSINHL